MLLCVKTKKRSGVIMCENKKGEWCYHVQKQKGGVVLSCVKTKRGSGVIMCENKKGEWCYHV